MTATTTSPHLTITRQKETLKKDTDHAVSFSYYGWTLKVGGVGGEKETFITTFGN